MTAVDMGDFYRVPADNRTLNYDKYFTDRIRQLEQELERLRKLQQKSQGLQRDRHCSRWSQRLQYQE